MKKLLICSALTLFGITTATSQEIRFGAKAGVNFATFGGDNIGDIKSKTGFHVGALVEIPVNERFWVQPEILYTAQGAKVEAEYAGPINPITATTTFQLDYIQVPIMGKYYVIEGLAIEAGPQVAFLVKSTGEFETTIAGVNVKEEMDLDDGISKIDFSLGVGASYRLDMGVFFGARYNFGLTNIYKDSDSDSKNQNRVFQISAGYSF